MQQAYLLLYLVLFAWTVYTVARHGIGRAFALCLLPAVLLFNFAQAVQMPLLPNLKSLSIVMYGVCVGLILRPQELRKLRWNWIDTGMVLMLLPVFFTTLMNGGQPLRPGLPPEPASLKLAQRYAMEFGITWLFPYFMARLALQDADGRRIALKALCVLSIGIGLLAAVESSGLRPNGTARALYRLKLNTTTVGQESSMVFKRFGLARAIATAGQQIDLGNVGVLVGTMILVLIPATAASWTRPLHLGGILGAGAMVIGSVSMTSWVAMAVAFVCYFLFTRPGLGRYLVVPILLAQFAFMLAQSSSMLNADNPIDRPGTDVGDSRWIRVKIMQEAWPLVSTAGWLGHGYGADVSKVGIGSVDNSYLLFIIQIGWLGLALWVGLMLIVAVMGARAFGRVTTDSERLPLAAMLAGTLGITFAMYTVFFGFVYAILFACVLGMVSSMCQLLTRQRPAAVSLHGGMPPAYGVIAGGMR
ncbi:MAG TPA: O-antigen ligase family protein [Tepidisphaeraceae bacterium]|jgi:hypothetical protein